MIAAQLYTLRRQLHDPGILERLREIGYEAVEVAGLEPATAEGFGEELRRAGLVACAAHVSVEALLNDLANVAAQCRAWGCRFVVVPSLPPPYHSGEGFRRFAGEAVDIAHALTPFELRLAYHNHSFELERWDGKAGLEILFEAAPPAALDAELDTYWLQVAGASPVAWLQSLTGRVPLVHLKDAAVVGGRVVQAEVGEGNLDWPGILAACRGAGTEWFVVEQDETDGDPLESLAVSYRNLDRFLERQPPRPRRAPPP
jgi:sugar phosphate isomerase/epimerase